MVVWKCCVAMERCWDGKRSVTCVGTDPIKGLWRPGWSFFGRVRTVAWVFLASDLSEAAMVPLSIGVDPNECGVNLLAPRFSCE